MGEVLRNLLINGNKKPAPEPAVEQKVKEASKPPPATKNDVDAFKKLVTPLVRNVILKVSS